MPLCSPIFLSLLVWHSLVWHLGCALCKLAGLNDVVFSCLGYRGIHPPSDDEGTNRTWFEPNKGLENAFLSAQSMATNPRKGQGAGLNDVVAAYLAFSMMALIQAMLCGCPSLVIILFYQDVLLASVSRCAVESRFFAVIIVASYNEYLSLPKKESRQLPEHTCAAVS